MNKKQEFMKEKPIFKLLVSMSVPVMLSMLIQSLYNIVDSIWVTKLGTDALTAVSLAFPLQNIVLSVGVGMGIGVGALVSINLGSGNREEANHTASLGVLLVLLHCVLFIVGGLVVTKPFLQMFTDDPQILKWACDYTYIVLCFSSGHLMQMCLEKIFQSVGKMKTTMFLMASGGIINMILDPILIFGWFGIPAMGVRGAAIATVIGQFAALFLYIAVYFKKDIGVTLSPKFAGLDKERAFAIYKISVPSALMLATPSVLTGILNGILTELGDIYVAVLGLYFKLQTFINLPANGIVQGMRPIIGYNYGAGETKRVKQTIRYGMIMIGIIMAIGTVGSIIFPAQILKIFDAEPELMEQGVLALRIIGASFIISTIGVVACGVFEAMGKGRDSLIISLLRQLVIVVPVGFMLSRFWGAAGIWLAFPIAEIAALFVSLKMLKKVRFARN